MDLQPGKSSHHRQRASGFTIVELMVVIGIVAILFGILLPVVARARASARDVTCASNMRQLATALISYASSNASQFPPNAKKVELYWYSKSVIESHASAPLTLSDGTFAGGVMRCPNDMDDAIRSYSMNMYATSLITNAKVLALLNADPPQRGKLFKLGAAPSSSLMLLVESWPELKQPEAKPVGYCAEAIVGFLGKPGERFGAGKGVIWTTPPGATPGRFDVRPSQITFYRHRRQPGRMEDPTGAANFAFLDGHVQMYRQDELADLRTGKSRYVALWSPIDRELEQAP